MISVLIKKFDEEEGSGFWKKLETKDLAAIATETCLFTFPELQVMTYDVLQNLNKDADKIIIKKKLLEFAKEYSRATTLASYVKRSHAAKEIAELLQGLTHSEFAKLSADEKASCEKLVKILDSSQMKNAVPAWFQRPAKA